MPSYTLTINGKRRAVEADAEMPLLWVLRDLIGLTGTKYGCGEGICGSCTVLEDGVAIRSCQTPVSAAEGRAYTTIEGLSEKGDDPIQRAWLAEDVSQCGYCQPGMMLELKSLLAKNATPAPAEIDDALSDHVCRCGSYPRIRRAAMAVVKGGSR